MSLITNKNDENYIYSIPFPPPIHDTDALPAATAAPMAAATATPMAAATAAPDATAAALPDATDAAPIAPVRRKRRRKDAPVFALAGSALAASASHIRASHATTVTTGRTKVWTDSGSSAYMTSNLWSNDSLWSSSVL